MDFRIVKRVIKSEDDKMYLSAINSLKGKDLTSLKLDDINELIEFLQFWNRARRVGYRNDEVKKRILGDIQKSAPYFKKLESEDLLKINLDDSNITTTIKTIFDILAILL